MVRSARLSDGETANFQDQRGFVLDWSLTIHFQRLVFNYCFIMITCKTSVTLSGGFVRLPPHTLTLPAVSIWMMTMLMLLTMVMTAVVIFFHGRSRFAKKRVFPALVSSLHTLCHSCQGQLLVSSGAPGLPGWHTACHQQDCARGRRTMVTMRSRRA